MGILDLFKHKSPERLVHKKKTSLHKPVSAKRSSSKHPVKHHIKHKNHSTKYKKHKTVHLQKINSKIKAKSKKQLDKKNISPDHRFKKNKKKIFVQAAKISKKELIKDKIKIIESKISSKVPKENNKIRLNHDEIIHKLKTGIPGFDKLFKEGIPQGAAILLEGGPGSGKTIFGLQVAYNACKQGKRVLYMTFEEPERRLRHHMKNFGWDSDKYEKVGLLKIKKFNSLDVSRSVEALLSEAKKELLIDIQPVLIPPDFKPEIVCVDSLSSIASAFTGEQSRFRIYMEQLFKYLETHDITSFLVRETPVPTHLGSTFSSKSEAISFLSDGIICIYNIIFSNGKRGRAIEILKMRGEEIDRRIVEAEIVNKKGFVVYPNKQINLDKNGGYHIT